MTTRNKLTGSKALWTRMTNIFSTITYEVKMTITDKEMQVIAVDGSHVTLIEMKVPDDAFEYYEVQRNETLGIELDKMKMCTNTLKKPLDTASLECKSGTGIVAWTSTYQDATQCLLDWESMPNPKMPVIKWEDKPECTVPTDWLLDAFLTAKNYGDITDLTISRLGEDKELWFSVSIYNEIGEGTTVKYPLGTDEGNTGSQSYSVQLLVPHIRKIKASKCKETTLQFDARHPVLITNEWDDGTTSRLFLAPRNHDEGA